VQIDFHYCTIRVLAEKAGFAPEDAQIIAFASQHVDDAVDHEKMNVDGHLDILSHRFAENTFDPICTAHKGLQHLQGFKVEVQHKIYVPFHFLPDFEGLAGFLVNKNCKLSRKLVVNAMTELCKNTGEYRILNLIRLGIALHTFSDSWAHQNFSGTHDSKYNDIKSIEIFKNGKWESIPALLKFEYDALPDIGHAEVGRFPDISHLKWRFTKESETVVYERDNTQLYLEAAENIVELFQGFNDLNEWEDVKQKLQECFSFETENLVEKFKKFQRTFPEIGFYYDELQWRNEALQLVERSKLKEMIDKKPAFVIASDKKWFYFHLAAHDQRNLVLGLIQNMRPLPDKII
jgi:hypothetical protein